MKVLFLMIFMTSAHATWYDDVDYSSRLSADGGELKLLTFYNLLAQFDIEVIDGITQRSEAWEENELIFSISNAGSLALEAPYGGLKAVSGGQLNLNGQFSWQLSNGETIQFNNLTVRPRNTNLGPGALTILEVINQSGDVVFIMDHIHAGFNDNRTQLFLENMDVRISSWLANKMGMPELADHVAAQAHIYSNLVIPTTYVAKSVPRGACVPGGNWPPQNPDVDVALVGMNNAVSYGEVVGNEDYVIFTPSATLENVGTADVAWYQKFSGNYPPYGNDQHPYLIWNMYREIDGRFEQIGVSGIKHAFYTVNTVCSCSGGQVLFPTCHDTYSVSNNHSAAHMGPRDGLDNAYQGLWQSTGSFFDLNGDGSQDNYATASGENRMNVAKVDFADDDLSYYLSAWYLIRDDVNIFNNMGYRKYDIRESNSGSNGWLLSPQTNFADGPASDQYVTPNSINLAAGEASQRNLQNGEGHLTVAVKVFDLGNGKHRYNYMVENHDYDTEVQSIILPLLDSASMTEFVFSDIDMDGANDWVVTRSNDLVTLQAPSGNEIDWGILYSFSFTSNAVPQEGKVSLLGLGSLRPFPTSSISPGELSDIIFMHDFENLN